MKNRENSLVNNTTICIAGKTRLAVEALKYVVNQFPDCDICCIPNTTDSGVDTWQPSLLKAARDLSVPRVALDDIYDIEDLLFISLEFGELVKPHRFKSRKLYNIHFSQLPKYKGMYTSAHPLLSGESESGVTLHLIDAGIDTGNIIDRRSFDISLSDTSRDLYLRCLDEAVELFRSNINGMLNGTISSVPQSFRNSSYYSRKSIDYSRLCIDCEKTAFEVHNQFRAFTFREFQMPEYHGWKISKTEITNERSNGRPGTTAMETEDYFLVWTIDYNIKLFKDYYPVLWEACRSGDCTGFTNALRFIEDVDLRDRNGWTALMIAAFNGAAMQVKMLIERGADRRIVGYEGKSVLMCALMYFDRSRDDAIVRVLLDHDADVYQLDDKWKSVESHARDKGLDE
jgi:methionyl-tRNA formyltransferase